MESKDIVSKIKELAYENVNKKLEEEREKTELKIKRDLEKVNKCLEYITNKMVFKIIGDSYYTREYRLANEEMFFNDYNIDSKIAWRKGIIFREEEEKSKYDALFTVNGESYYDMRYIIRSYEKTFERYEGDLKRLNENFNEIKKAAERLKEQEPLIKSFIEQYKKIDIVENLEDD